MFSERVLVLVGLKLLSADASGGCVSVRFNSTAWVLILFLRQDVRRYMFVESCQAW